MTIPHILPTGNQLYWISEKKIVDTFPSVETALSEPNGLLAIGNQLTTKLILTAYPKGIFPWFTEHQPVLWWSPDPRCVLWPHQFKISRSLRKVIRQQRFDITINQNFFDVIRYCATPRQDNGDTWLTRSMQEINYELHQQGYAHSVECWQKGRLVGGLYGLLLGQVFFGESMFSNVTNSSKVALAFLIEKLQAFDVRLVDCQVHSAHLETLGAVLISRVAFQKALQKLCALEKVIFTG